MVVIPTEIKAQYGTTEGLILLSGEVVGPEGTGLMDVHVQNLNNRQVTVTDNTGFFSIYVHHTHRLRFSAVGYRPFYLEIEVQDDENNLYEVIKMRRETIALDEITITPEEIERATNMMMPQSGEPLFSIGYQGEPGAVKPNVGNPISFLYYWFSRGGKQMRKLEELKKQGKISGQVDDRFESELFWELTGLVGEELEEFKAFCNMSDSFIMYSSEYDFILKVNQCFDEFKN